MTTLMPFNEEIMTVICTDNLEILKSIFHSSYEILSANACCDLFAANSQLYKLHEVMLWQFFSRTGLHWRL